MIKVIYYLLLFNMVHEAYCIESEQNQILNLDLTNPLIESISELGTFVLSKYFKKTRCFIFVTEDNTGDEILNKIKIFKFSYYFKITPLSDLEPFVEFAQGAIEEACFGLILIVRDPTTYLNAFFKASKRSVGRGESIILHLITPNQTENSTEWSPEVWSSLVGGLFHRSLFTRLNGDQELLLVTQRFVGQENPSQEIQLARWLNGSRLEPKNINLYPDKTRHLQGKPLKSSIFDYKPNVVVNKPPPESSNFEESVFSPEELGIDGIEISILETYAEYVNATLTYIIEPKQWGDVFPNDSGFGALGRVAMDEAEFGTGAIYLWYPIWLRVDYSVPFCLAGLGLLAPRPQTVSPWLLIIVPFTWEMWVAVSLSILFGTLALFLAARRIVFIVPGLYGTWSRSLLAVWGMLVGQAPPQARGALGDKDDTLTAHLINVFLLCCLLVSSSYSGGLSSVLTLIRFEPPIDNGHDLLASKVPWVADDEAWILSFISSDNEFFKELSRQFQVMTPAEIRRRSQLRQIALIVERITGGITGDHFALNTLFITEDLIPYLRLMKEDLIHAYEVILVRKNSPYLFHLNHVITRLWEGGLFFYMNQVTVLRTMSTHLQLAVRNSQDVEQPKETPLRMEHIQAAMALLIVGLAASCMMFIYEICSGKQKKKKNSL